MMKRPREKDAKHLAFIRTLPCLVCGNNIETEAAHIRMADPMAGKPYTGKGEKPSDKWAVPLCGTCHREQHHFGEERYWIERDPVKAAFALWENSGDHETCVRIVEAHL